VVAAAQAALERNGELERGAAVRAVQMEHADAPAAIAEDHEIFAEDAHAARRSIQIAREGDRLPEAPQVFAAGGAGTDLGQLRIGGRRRPARVSVIGRHRAHPHAVLMGDSATRRLDRSSATIAAGRTRR
jgi:hypothetical protein